MSVGNFVWINEETFENGEEDEEGGGVRLQQL